jgi:hypothetical protein
MQKRYVQALDLNPGFGDCEMRDVCSGVEINYLKKLLINVKTNKYYNILFLICFGE